ncbi:MAG: PepSY domain-containing protein [Acidobacteria bacterium]|nr:PepSY domain-containing protein [Acidobacteriota bacterium]MBV9475100.1 PepSY domain-containing protein [Acidobacteriota bacterium]
MRRALFWLHLAAGVVCGIVILIMSVTGVLLAFEREVVAAFDRTPRAAAHATPPLPIDALLANSERALHGTPTMLTIARDPSLPLEIGVGRERVVFVDRSSGATREGSRGVRRFFRVVESLHRWLGASDASRDRGRVVTGACNLAFLVLVCTGPFLWWPRRWSWPGVRAIVWFRRGLSARARDFNWHNAIGIWSFVPLLVIVATGVVMSYPWANALVYRMTGSPVPPREPRPLEARAAKTDGVLHDVARLLPAAEQQVRDWKRISARVPAPNADTIVYTIDRGDGGRPDLRAQLTLDRRTGRVVKWQPFASQNAGRRMRTWIRFSHTGEAGGMAGRAIAAIATAGAVVLVWTGLALALRRLAQWLRTSRRNAVS